MEVVALSKFIRLSPKKLNLVAAALRNLSVSEAEKILPHLEQKGARFLLLVLKQGVANAVKNFGLKKETLKIKRLEITKGPSYKRGRPVSRGRWHPILKRTSHIKMILEGEKSNEPEETKSKSKKKTLENKKLTKKESKDGTKS
ncbi:50S ribosomal protein L22 [Candidatus Shapirobacteria bacterium]|nr:50S ribosomal protein L22 [Candidatus Shapirobacteria bacterium]